MSDHRSEAAIRAAPDRRRRRAGRRPPGTRWPRGARSATHSSRTRGARSSASLGWTPLRYVIETGRPARGRGLHPGAAAARLPGPTGPAAGPLRAARPDPARADAAKRRGGAGRAARDRREPRQPDADCRPGLARGRRPRRPTLAKAGFRPAAREVQVSRTAMVVPLRRRRGRAALSAGRHHGDQHQQGPPRRRHDRSVSTWRLRPSASRRWRSSSRCTPPPASERDSSSATASTS